MEMDEERIGMVLVRASELHSKIATCIQKSSLSISRSKIPSIEPLISTNGGVDNVAANDPSTADNYSLETDEDADALLDICDAFDSLESHLSSLQALQQQQQYEREAVIRDIEYNRKMLLKKLSEYKGEHLDVIREAEAFASMKVERDNELLLPPYPTHTPHSLVLDNGHISRFSNARKLVQNGHDGRAASNKNQTQDSPNKLWGGLRFLFSYTAKSMLTLVGVISLLSLAGYEPKLKKKGASFRALTIFDTGEKKPLTRCPPGKVAVMRDGEIHCIVKERVEIPFDSVAADPDVNYGCG